MSTAPSTQPTAVGTARKSRAATTAAATEAKPDPPGEMPEDLRARGWTLREHVGPDRDKFQCVNTALGLTTNPFFVPQQAIQAARITQEKYDNKHPPEQVAASANGKGYAVTRTFSQLLKVKLSPDGLQEKCAEYDTTCAEKEQMEADFKRVHDQYKEDLKAKEAEVQQLSAVVRKQSVEVEVECEERFDYKAKRVVVVRLDTKEEIESREMTVQEMQQKLPSL